MCLTTEIEDLERQLGELNMRTSQVDRSLNKAESIKDATAGRISTQGGVQITKGSAEGSQRRFVSTKGLFRVAPILVATSSITLTHKGCCPLSCLTNSFSFSDGSSIQCKSEVDESHFSAKGKREKLSKHAMTFMRSRCSFLSSVLSNKELETAEEMRCLVRQLDWTLGRVESTARELTALQKRFIVSLETDPDGGVSEFLVRVSFEGMAQKGSLVTTFELNPSYPFGPLNVSLEPGHSDLDLSHLQKHLMKNAKPGFGYLSRACDVISAVMQIR